MAKWLRPVALAKTLLVHTALYVICVREKCALISCNPGDAKFAFLTGNLRIFSHGNEFSRFHFRTSRVLYNL